MTRCIVALTARDVARGSGRSRVISGEAVAGRAGSR